MITQKTIKGNYRVLIYQGAFARLYHETQLSEDSQSDWWIVNGSMNAPTETQNLGAAIRMFNRIEKEYTGAVHQKLDQEGERK